MVLSWRGLSAVERIAGGKDSERLAVMEIAFLLPAALTPAALVRFLDASSRPGATQKAPALNLALQTAGTSSR
jgi:hypothetical protein